MPGPKPNKQTIEFNWLKLTEYPFAGFQGIDMTQFSHMSALLIKDEGPLLSVLVTFRRKPKRKKSAKRRS